MNNNSGIIGWDQLKWGDTVEHTLNLYEGLVEITANETIEFGISTFARERKKLFIERQEFNFFQNKLYSVSLIFYNIDPESDNIIYKKFIEKYGETKEVSGKKQYIENNIYNDITEVVYRISEEMIILITVTEKKHKITKEILRHDVVYNYFNPKTISEINSIMAKINTDDIIV